ncbi:MAG: hypothetical protein ACTSXQ_07970 [Alphaproteobacteria bacterium]
MSAPKRITVENSNGYFETEKGLADNQDKVESLGCRKDFHAKRFNDEEFLSINLFLNKKLSIIMDEIGSNLRLES